MLNFDFLEKGLGIVPPPLYSINWPNSIVSLPLLLDILGNMCIAIVCFSGFDVINFEINLYFYSSGFSTWPKIKNKNLTLTQLKRF